MNRAAGESLSKDKRKDDVEQSFRRDQADEDAERQQGVAADRVIAALTLHTSNKKRVSP